MADTRKSLAVQICKYWYILAMGSKQGSHVSTD